MDSQFLSLVPSLCQSLFLSDGFAAGDGAMASKCLTKE